MSTAAGHTIRVAAFSTEGVFNTVLDSQVVVPLQFIGRQRPDVARALIILTSVRHRGKPQTVERSRAIAEALPGVRTAFLDRAVGGLPFEDERFARLLRRGLATCGFDGTAPIVVHCRGARAASAAVIARRKDPRLRVLLDLRGAIVDEIPGNNPLSWWRRYQSARTARRALGGADALNTVSHKLAEHAQATGGLAARLPRSVVGCCVDTGRFRFDPQWRAARRRELGFGDRFVVCYCGGMSHWQRPDAVAEAYAAIRGALPDAHMFVLSRQAGPLVEHLQRLGVGAENVTVHGAAHADVPAYLTAADVGLLLREDSLTNRVASPVKFAEYLRCGLPVILTPYIGDFSALVAAEGVGALVDFPIRPAEVAEAARGLRARLAEGGDTYRAACSALSGARFGWDAQVPQLLDLYEALSARGASE